MKQKIKNRSYQDQAKAAAEIKRLLQAKQAEVEALVRVYEQAVAALRDVEQPRGEKCC